MLPAVEDAHDNNFSPLHLVGDKGASLETNGAQAGPQIVPQPAPIWESGQRHTGRFDPVDIGSGDVRPGILKNGLVEGTQIRIGLRAEANLVLSHSAWL